MVEIEDIQEVELIEDSEQFMWLRGLFDFIKFFCYKNRVSYVIIGMLQNKFSKYLGIFNIG